MSSDASPDSAGHRAVEPFELEGELAGLWQSLRSGPDSEESLGRTCMSNLMVYCANDEELDRSMQDIREVVRRHPSRVIMMTAGVPALGHEIDASVQAFCHVAGGDRKLYSECAVLRAGEAAAARLAPVIRPLLIGDLPTALWWTPTEQAPPLSGPLFQQLAAMADQVIYDSRGWRDPVTNVVALADWAAARSPRQLVSDLAWRRLRPWRSLIGQTLDPSLAPGALDSICEVHIEHGPHALPKAWLLIGWLASSLGWKPASGKTQGGVQITWEFESRQGPIRAVVDRRSEGDPELYRVAIRWTSGSEDHTEVFELLGPERLGLTTEGGATTSRVLTALLPTRASLLADQLPDQGRDAIFSETLGISRSMANELLGLRRQPPRAS